jgi:hypothetical protein
VLDRLLEGVAGSFVVRLPVHGPEQLRRAGGKWVVPRELDAAGMQRKTRRGFAEQPGEAFGRGDLDVGRLVQKGQGLDPQHLDLSLQPGGGVGQKFIAELIGKLETGAMRVDIDLPVPERVGVVLRVGFAHGIDTGLGLVRRS